MSVRTRLSALMRRRSEAPPSDPWERDYAVMSDAERRIVDAALPLTMTEPPHLHALIDAVRYCVCRDIPGDLAECGVWRGGSVLAMVLALQELGADDRGVHLFDTFEGMTPPSERDTSPLEQPATTSWEDARGRGEQPWSFVFKPEVFNEDEVRRTLLATGYPEDRIHLVRGPVEETLPEQAPEKLALLRLDTDWYESTRHELEHLYPRLSPGGVLIIDDYGHWEGCRRAVDEYLATLPQPLLLTRIDYTARLAIKQ